MAAKKSSMRRSTGRPARSSTARGSAAARTPEKQAQSAARVKAGTAPAGRAASRPGEDAKVSRGKVGGSRAAAKEVGGKLDFGIPAENARPARRREKTRVDSPSARAGRQGQRVVGVGAYGDTPGKSGGDSDTDILGIGTQGGSSVSTSGTLGRKRGKDLTTKGGAAPFGSGAPAKGKNQAGLVGKVGGSKRVRGTTHNAADDAGEGGGGTGVGDRVDRSARERANRDRTINKRAGGPARRELDENRS